MCPFSQKNGWTVVESVNENPTTWLRSFTSCPKLTGPPRLPRSCITPFFQRKARTTVFPDESTMLVSDQPVTFPDLLIERAPLEFPPRVPKSSISPFFHSTALISGSPDTGSIKPFCESPTTVPLSLTAWDALSNVESPGNCVMTPFRHTKPF